MTFPMNLPKSSSLIASPKMIDGNVILKPECHDNRSEEQRQKDLLASQTFQNLYLSPDN